MKSFYMIPAALVLFFCQSVRGNDIEINGAQFSILNTIPSHQHKSSIQIVNHGKEGIQVQLVRVKTGQTSEWHYLKTGEDYTCPGRPDSTGDLYLVTPVLIKKLVDITPRRLCTVEQHEQKIVLALNDALQPLNYPSSSSTTSNEK
ncbi:hypothetical protein [Candidatus Finniella inopinata]|uniref:Uncharacterized protein n=1 Tax=Candidatus Finniella inopinata TaxID=1696036 RepID=A0A4Q7DKI1_9PROT|nr:hypothetical protein [Candidatus Finniella inopinata]RZI46594.1 hypothetical protein EQU50_03130 [Candidatus Finniella inopinata]